jgi:hypothetical protein
MTMDQVAFNLSDATTNLGSMIPWIENSLAATKSIDCGIYPSLMGYFDFPTPISYIHTTPINRVASFRTTYIQDPWTLPSPSNVVEGRVHIRMVEPLSAVEIAYLAIQQGTTNPDQNPMIAKEDDLFPKTIWAQKSSSSQDCLNIVLPSNKAII